MKKVVDKNTALNNLIDGLVKLTNICVTKLYCKHSNHIIYHWNIFLINIKYIIFIVIHIYYIYI